MLSHCLSSNVSWSGNNNPPPLLPENAVFSFHSADVLWKSQSGKNVSTQKYISINQSMFCYWVFYFWVIDMHITSNGITKGSLLLQPGPRELQTLHWKVKFGEFLIDINILIDTIYPYLSAFFSAYHKIVLQLKKENTSQLLINKHDSIFLKCKSSLCLRELELR